MSLGYGQQYGKVELINGEFIEGKNLFISDKSVSIDIHRNFSKNYSKSDVDNVWRGNPSLWELRKATMIGISIGSFIGIVDGTSLGSEDPGAFGMIPFCGVIGFFIDYAKTKNKYQNVTDNWQLIWTRKNFNKQKSNNSSFYKYSEIERLWDLKEKGIITEQEFLKKKKELLGE